MVSLSRYCQFDCICVDYETITLYNLVIAESPWLLYQLAFKHIINVWRKNTQLQTQTFR